jgi:hypothetical protein
MSRLRVHRPWFAVLFLLLLLQPSLVWAGADGPDDETSAQTSDSGFEVGSSHSAANPGQTQSTASEASSDSGPPPATQTGGWIGRCLGMPASCVNEQAAAASAAPLIERAFRRLPLPASGLVVQPPGGKTLVNFDTIFSTEAEPFERTVRLLGREVRLRIWASSFSWHFGDDSEPLSTTEAGRTYQRGLPMDSYISHQYRDADVTVHPRVNTTYSAEYSVDGQPFQPVIGTVTIDGVPATLRVVEARPVLTGTR